MLLSDLLRRSSKIYSKNTFIDNHDDKSLTYEDAQWYSLCHREWIKHLIQQNVPFSCGHDIDIVISYLSQNTPQLLLSLIGCVGIGHMNIGRSKRKINTAMLNVRWSAKEIAQALSTKHDNNIEKKHNNDSNRTIYVTIILYGDNDDIRKVAKDAASVMNKNKNSHGEKNTRNGKHITLAFELPNLMTVTPSSPTKNNVHNEQKPQTSIHDDAIILFTSGTTSGPKGVKLSHLALIIQSMAKTQMPCSYDSETKMLATTVPFFHVGGLSSALAIIMAGGCLVFPQNNASSFDAKMVLNSMGERKSDILNTKRSCVDTLVIVPAMLHSILQEVRRKNSYTARNSHDNYNIVYHNVRLLLIGGQSLTKPQLDQSKLVFPNARIVQTFACTEAASSITFATIHDPIEKRPCRKNNDDMCNPELNGTYVGIPPPHIELQIFAIKNDKTTQIKAAPFTIGAIGTRGCHIMNGYWRRGHDKGYGITKDQWLITNDLGYMDYEERLYFCGRLNDVIRSGGETIFAPEVESVLIQHPSIDQCAVFALPDERFGECVCAAVIMKKRNHDDIQKKVQNTDDITQQVREFCKSFNLTSYKRPRRVFILEKLPQNSSGKVLKHVLKDQMSIESRL
mmetsp:Transcript_13475/g.16331  ORF Transcript_13475/g.16331 Transcript_13475/m.16331 type:complete len:623 (-) Transcript_13475:820-2688(-)